MKELIRCYLCPNLWEYYDTICTYERISHLCKQCWEKREDSMQPAHIKVLFGLIDHSGAEYRIKACEKIENMRQIRFNTLIQDLQNTK